METKTPELVIDFHTWANTTRHKQERVINIVMAAFMKNHELWDMRFPRRMENLSSLMGIYHRYMITDLFKPTVYTMSASIGGEVVAHAVWEFQGRDVNKWPEVIQRDSWSLWIHRAVYGLYKKIRSLLFFRELNWVNQPAIDRFIALNAILEPRYIPDTVPTLFLKLVVVDPAYQRRGIGAALMDWGIVKAQKDGLRLALRSTKAGLKLYKNKGFELIDSINAFHVNDDAEAHDEDGHLLPGLHCADGSCNFGEGYFMIRETKDVEKHQILTRSKTD